LCVRVCVFACVCRYVYVRKRHPRGVRVVSRTRHARFLRAPSRTIRLSGCAGGRAAIVRLFGEVGDLIDRGLEMAIFDELARGNVGPVQK
jgi:NADPH-dependent 2,4-dienoyl-CoA reductase/sulfur reductase-like enzyme